MSKNKCVPKKNIYKDKTLSLKNFKVDKIKNYLRQRDPFKGFKLIFKIILFIFLKNKYSNQNVEEIKPDSIIVATGGNLGGSIISIPLIQGIRNKWPNAHLVVISNRKHSLEIIKTSVKCEEYILIPDVSLINSLFNKKINKLKNHLSSFSPDLFVGNHNFRLSYLLPLKKIKYCISSINFLDFAEERFLFDKAIPYKASKENWLENYWDILKILSIREEYFPKIKANQNKGIELLKDKFSINLEKKELIGIQAGVWEQHAFRAWPTKKMAEFCNLLLNNQNIILIIIGTSNQYDLLNYLKKYSVDFSRIYSTLGLFSIQELLNVVSTCKLVVSNDSGLMHVSASLSVPTLALYGPTIPNTTWVYGDSICKAIIMNDDGRPNYEKMSSLQSEKDYFYKSRDNMKNISPQFVYSKALKLLENIKQSNNF